MTITRRSILRTLGALPFAAPLFAEPSSEPTVPDELAEIYRKLDGWLDQTLAQLPSSGATKPAHCAHLMSISGQDPKLALAPTWRAYHRAYADALRMLGLTMVEVEVSYPGFTRALNPDLDAYLDCYRYVAETARAMEMKLVAKHNPILAMFSPDAAPIVEHYATLTRRQFFEERYAEALEIVDVCDPDYFVLCGEPGNIPKVDGHAMTVADWREYHTTFSERLRRDRPSLRAKLGAAAGSWEDPALFRMFAEVEGLDFVDLHFYPIRAGASDEIDLLMRGVEWCDALKRVRPDMGVVIGEAWLYKTTPAETRSAGMVAREVFARDLWSFWAPLDIKMLDAVERIGAAIGADYISPFWSFYFFTYLDYGVDPPDSFRASLLQALRSGAVTRTGRAYAARDYRG